MILVDTGVLSLAFRRKRRDLNPEELRQVYALENLFKQGLVVLIGPIRQEVLSGISEKSQFERLRQHLGYLEDLPLGTETFVLAADFYNRCRTKGVAPGDIDMIICAAAHVHAHPIFSADPDFQSYEQVLPIKLYHT